MFLKKKGSSFEWMIVGLGNPGLQYAETRHNAGFMAVDRILENGNAKLDKHKFEAEYGEVTVAGARALVVKPQTYMNNSGRAVTAIASFYKIPTENIIILFDDISLPVGGLRVRRKGSAGGHNGMKDIIQLLGTEELTRVKIGVGQKPHPDYNLADWVLGKFPKEDRPALEEALKKAAKAVEEIVRNGVDSAMNKYSH